MIELLNTAVIPLVEYERLRAIERAVDEKGHLSIEHVYIMNTNGTTKSIDYKVVSESKIIDLLAKELAAMKEKERVVSPLQYQ